ncbi:phosphoribosylamine--glycine ligase [uncultured Intestinimonas sp.]|uniref:phosphoribosylamine--glycine ligase n=1 Tax=uncultured Intestinimonas sp. TaxID=1689265 RepID=UPI0025EDE8BC|nr:phosphoribosylamine--glycine ligase [uncultured Intestinimonas sp.]
MKVLVVGGGGREHAIVRTLAKSPKIDALYCAPGNGGIAAQAQCVPIKATDVEAMVAWAKEHAMDFVVVAPDDPLALGMVDALEAAGIPAFGPRANAAIIEASKVFSKALMEKYHIPTARYRSFTDLDEALAYIRQEGAPIVVKADGLALGKGVVVAQTVAEAEEAARSMMADGKFGAAGAKVVIEECMTGPEVTVLCFVDGEHLSPMPPSRDHKRAFDGDKGPNTGGMGAISPAPGYTPEIADRCMKEIFLPTVAALKAEGRPFHGVLYFGLMLTPDGPKVVEYNARFGDPECQAVLSLLETDLMDIFQACREGTLDRLDIRWKDAAACCLVLASGGYPAKYATGYPITGLEEAEQTAVVFHAGTKRDEDGTIRTSGGRVLGVTAVGDDLNAAIDGAYAAAKHISFQDMHFRTDIGRTF